jgi:hypothetical protein
MRFYRATPASKKILPNGAGTLTGKYGLSPIRRHPRAWRGTRCFAIRYVRDLRLFTGI